MPPPFLYFIISRFAPYVKKGRDIIAESIGKRMGRPLKSGEAKDVSLHLRISKSEAERIKNCSEQLGIPRTDTIMQGIELLENMINGKK